MSAYNEFRRIGIDCQMRSSGNAKVSCPKCQERKPGNRDKDLSINYDTGAYKCHSAKCGWNGYAKPVNTNYSRPEWKNNTELPAKTVKWFEGRGISQATLQKMRITTDEKGNIEFNYFRSGELVNVKTRFEIEGKKGFKQHTNAEKIVYGLDTLSGKKKAIFVEGEMDVLSWVEAGVLGDFGIISVDMGAPSPGQNSGGKLDCLTNCALELDGIKEFYICTDKDEPGQYLQDELVRRLGEHRCHLVSLPKGAKDTNDVLKDILQEKDVKCETLRLYLKNARPVPIPGIYELDDATWDLMIDQYRNGREKGKTTHFPNLDKHYSFLAKEITLVTGIPSHGKSQFLRQLVLCKAMYDGWKWACYVPEDWTIDYFFEDLCHTFIGKSSDKAAGLERMTEQELIEAMTFVRSHFFCIYPEVDKESGISPLPTNEWINQRINFLKLKHGVNAYLKDPWNKIFHDFQMREDQYLAQELSKEKFFAGAFDAALYVAHPTKLNTAKDGSYEVPTAYNISGGAMWYNMMDNILAVHRPNLKDNADDKLVEIYIHKIKKRKLVGKPGQINIYFDWKKNRYFQFENDYNPMESQRAEIVAVDDLEDIPF